MNTYQIILSIIGSIATLQDLVMKIMETARQNAELTPEQDIELDERLKEMFAKPHWQPSDSN